MNLLPASLLSLILASTLSAQPVPAIKIEPAPKVEPTPKPEETPVIKVEPLGDATESVSSNATATPGKKWITRKFKITNISKTDYQIPGYSPDVISIRVYYKNAAGEWAPQDDTPYCGTGIELQPFPAGRSFIAEATFPLKYAGIEFIFRFTRISGTGPLISRTRETTQTPPLRMK